MDELANKLAALKGTEVIASHIAGDKIVFVLRSGPKYTMTEAELIEAINQAQPQEPFDFQEQREDGSDAPSTALSDNGGKPPKPPKAKAKKGK